MRINIAFYAFNETALYLSCIQSNTSKQSIHQNSDDKFLYVTHQVEYRMELAFICTWLFKQRYKNESTKTFLYFSTVVYLIYYYVTMLVPKCQKSARTSITIISGPNSLFLLSFVSAVLNSEIISGPSIYFIIVGFSLLLWKRSVKYLFYL